MSSKVRYLAMNLPATSDSDDSDTENDLDVDTLAPLEIGPGEHKLQYAYYLWFSKKGVHKPYSSTQIKATEEYSKSLHFVGRCATVEQWWSMYCHLIRPTDLLPFRELHLFKSDIKPMWEDPGNAKGGKWMIRLRKNRIDRAWENVCMAMLGEQFLVGPEICGVVLSTKFAFQEDFLSVWNRTATDQASTVRIRDTLKRVLNLPPSTLMEYKIHCDSLKMFSGKSRHATEQAHNSSSAAAAVNAAATTVAAAAATTAVSASSAHDIERKPSQALPS